ncbi:hypothetical protein DAPPUDRAFT_317855 [Daphnia pulex]|nr:hypothetical protein DAPPUDRAFT_317855 [Daphnia pulex]|eukprot:EFX81246.1 hypothetical protein DAPPUDRAFT_317855 [Daphnia pulex]
MFARFFSETDVMPSRSTMLVLANSEETDVMPSGTNMLIVATSEGKNCYDVFLNEIDVSFQDVWSASAKYIIEAAKTTGKKKVNSILSSGMFTTMTPELCSRAVVEILLYLIPGKGREDKAVRHLSDLRFAIISKLERSIHHETEAVIAMMTTYLDLPPTYLHLDYSAKVSNALLFIQSFVLGEKDHTTESCAHFQTFSA